VLDSSASADYLQRIKNRLEEDATAREERAKRRRKVLVDQMKAHHAQEVGEARMCYRTLCCKFFNWFVFIKRTLTVPFLRCNALFRSYLARSSMVSTRGISFCVLRYVKLTARC